MNGDYPIKSYTDIFSTFGWDFLHLRLGRIYVFWALELKLYIQDENCLYPLCLISMHSLFLNTLYNWNEDYVNSIITTTTDIRKASFFFFWFYTVKSLQTNHSKSIIHEWDYKVMFKPWAMIKWKLLFWVGMVNGVYSMQ